jgi:fructose/tagatose bisphosphate aldolase
VALAALSHLLETATAERYAVGYFEAWDTYSLEAVAEAAEAEHSPVVLGFGGMMMDETWLDRFGIEPLGAYGRAVAARLAVPAALILNEVPKWEHACRGLDAGFNVMMLDTSALPFKQNVELTRKLAALAHAKRVEVQAELGRLPTFGQPEAGQMTDPAQAGAFVAATGVDFLAVSVGNVHMQAQGASDIDLRRVRSIRRGVAVPLVIHGGSGLAREAVTALVEEGIGLFHVGTILKKRFWQAAAAALSTLSDPIDYQALVGSRRPADFLLRAKEAVTQCVRSLMRVYGSSGKAV